MRPNDITGSIRLLEVNGWALIHDPEDRSVFCCRRDLGTGCCRGHFHGWVRVCEGPRFLYGRWWLWRTPGQAFELALAWARTVHGGIASPAQREIERQVEITQITESL